MTLLVLAGGIGSRFGGFKQLEPLGPNGEYLLEYSLYDAIKAGFKRVVFVINDKIYELFKNSIEASGVTTFIPLSIGIFCESAIAYLIVIKPLLFQP